MDRQKIGVYVHWPYCARICPYCDFNIYKNDPDVADRLTEAIVRDLQAWRQMSVARDMVSIHFGGGTPSLMRPADLEKIIGEAQTLWSPECDLEIAMEANPNDITKERLGDWRAVGIERLSIGVQSFDDDVLKFLGRDHDGKSSQKALELAVQHMPRVSADFIYGWAGQTKSHWWGELAAALETAVGHISAYQLTIEEKTAFAKAERRGNRKAVDADTSADLFELVGSVLQAAGYDRYEVSNFAKSNADQSRHNLLYWQGEDYVGVGPGAHGRLTINGTRTATIATLKPNAYIDDVQKTGNGISKREALSKAAWAEEYLLMGLRIGDGICLYEYRNIADKDLNYRVCEQMIDDGLLVKKNGRLYTTDQGRMLLDSISHALLIAD
jgi:oxygen-independent coproporphyrinogen-3 oxidase